MRRFIKYVVLGLALSRQPAWASESFRLKNGDLIYTGMTKLELIAAAGHPLSTEYLVTTNNLGEQVRQDEQMLTYKLVGDIGGEYTVAAKVRRGKVVELEVIQLRR